MSAARERTDRVFDFGREEKRKSQEQNLEGNAATERDETHDQEQSKAIPDSEGDGGDDHKDARTSSISSSSFRKAESFDGLQKTGVDVSQNRDTDNFSESSEYSLADVPERFEWIFRDDLKNGTRPLCRITRPCVLSNGIVALPSWMRKDQKILLRCSLGRYMYYSSTDDLPGVVHKRDINADFALTLHLSKFQEPTHVSSVFLTEHILKSSFLFDVFEGDGKLPQDVQMYHCAATANSSQCAHQEDSHPVSLRPAIFVPRRIERGNRNSWSLKYVDMFGKAHSKDGSVVHLNASSILVKSHEHQDQKLSATCFRSILTVDAMFRHLPDRALIDSSLYSQRNGIDRSPKPRVGENCDLSIGILDLGESPRSIVGASDFRDRIEQFAKLALPSASISVELIEISEETSLESHIKQVQGLDVYIAGSGDEMSSLAFLRSSGTVFEIRQFGLHPTAHQSLAKSLGIRYASVQARPQTDSFKACLEGQVSQMRKNGIIEKGEFPPWYGDLLETWDKAAAKFALTGTTSFDILSDKSGIGNYDSRYCARMQTIVFNQEDAARAILQAAKELCPSMQS